MSNIALRCLVGAFAVVSITGCDATADRGFCQKTDKGYEICIKEEDIICRQLNSVGVESGDYCKASGISIDLVGEEKHWLNQGDPTNPNGEVHCWSNTIDTRITCIAARHFGKI